MAWIRRCCLGVGLTALISGPIIAAAGMELTLEAQQKSYLLGEPVRLTLRATNTDSKPVTAVVALHPELGMVSFFVSDDGETFKHYRGPGWGIRDAYAPPRPIAPGETFDGPIELLWNRVSHGIENSLQRTLAFPKEGCYWIKARPLLPEFREESNTLRICTTEPAGEDREVWKEIQSQPELARLIQRPTDNVSNAIVDKAGELLRSHPRSLYAPYFERALRTRDEMAPQAPPSPSGPRHI